MLFQPDLMTPDRIKTGLETKILGHEIISYAETTSTNDVALQLAGNGFKEGTLIVAESQTSGKGRRNRKWLAPMGTSILMSLILKPSIMISEAEIITLMSAAAVAQSILNITQLPALIKWPNDVMVNRRKVSGILTEMRTERGLPSFIVVGIGVTVNISEERLPIEIKDIATSLSIETGREISRISLLQEIIRQLEQRYLRLLNQDISSLMMEWRNLSATIGYKVQVNLPRRIIRGKAIDIDNAGALLIQQDTGQIQKISADMDFKMIYSN